ncbi:MAG: hypothetical protein EXR77_18740 [Myxococcales bacterium]|nr:hypothetical protein [Myxococcales bacterium]
MLRDPPSLFALAASASLGTLACGWAGTAWAQALVPAAADGPDAGDAATEDATSLLSALALGFGLTSTLAFWLHCLFGLVVVAPMLITVALVQVISLSVLAKAQGRPPHKLLRPDNRWLRIAKSAWGRGALVIGLLWWLRHDGSVSASSCVGEAAICAVGQLGRPCDVMRGNVGDAQLGNSGVIAGALALYGASGFRVLFAAVGTMLALGGWVAVRRTLALSPDTKWPVAWAPAATSWLGLLALSANPYTLSIPLLDENLLTLATSCAVLALALTQRPAWFVVGLLFAIVVDMRHPMLVCTPALLVFAGQSAPRGGRLKAIAGCSVGVVAGTAVENLHHLWAVGSLLRFEHNLQFAPLPYQIFGKAVQWPGMVNFPLHDHWVRTPHNPLPMLATWWLWLADHLGTLGLAALVCGAVALVRQSPRHGLLLLGWWLPVHGGLSLQEAWDYPNKMGILLIAAAVWPLWWAAWLAQTVRRPLAMLTLLVGLALVLQFGLGQLGRWQVPPDERYFARFDLSPNESQTHLAWSRGRALDMGLLPDYARATRYGSVLGRMAAGQLWQSQDALAWGWQASEVPARGRPMTVELDLSLPVWEGISMQPIELPDDATVDIDFMRHEGLWIAPHVRVPWEQTPLTIAAVRGPKLTLIELGFRDFRTRELGCDPALRYCHCRIFDTLEAGAGQRACGAHKVVQTGRLKLRMRLPSGGVSLFATVNPIGNLMYLWRGTVAPAAVHFEPLVEFWHN